MEERNVNIRLYSAKGCPFARRTRLVLHEKGAEFEAHEVDFRNKSEDFLKASPTGKVPVIVADGDSLYESNIVNQYLDEVYEEPRLMPEDPKARAYARIWMARAETTSTRRSSSPAWDASGVSLRNGSRRLWRS
jgi:glutathione S-transferase